MTPVRYTGLPDARVAFESLRPFHRAVIDMKCRYRPFGPEYLILDAVRASLATAAFHFTRDPNFFSAEPPG